jgi:hypothetical protein
MKRWRGFRGILFFVLINTIYMNAITVNNILKLDYTGLTNPTKEKIIEEIRKSAKDYDIPPIFLEKIIDKESSGGEQYKNGSVNIGDADDKYHYGFGMFQITYEVDFFCKQSDKKDCDLGFNYEENINGEKTIYFKKEEDKDKIKNIVLDWRKNVSAGYDKLETKFYLNWKESPPTISDNNSLILENWYYPIAWYNGEGKKAYNYVTAIYEAINGITDITSPFIINGFNIDTITRTGPTAYELKDIVNNGGKLHIWKDNSYVIYNLEFETINLCEKVYLIPTREFNQIHEWD